jgi:nucleoside-triphosphatase THEP1
LITILTGGVGSGKTTYLRSAIPLIRKRGVAVDGYLSERVMDGVTAAGYDLVDLQNGRRCRLLRRSAGGGADHVGPFETDAEGFAAAEGIIARSRTSDLLVVDEMGRLELEGKGVWPAAGPVLREAGRRVLVVIREALLEDFQARFRTEGTAVSFVRLPESKDPEVLARAIAEGRT